MFARLEGHTSSFAALVGKSLEAFNGMAFRHGGRTLIGWLKPVVLGASGGKTKNWYRVVCSFSFFLFKLYKCSGSPGVVKYTKACQVLLMQSIGKHRIEDSSALGVRVKRSRRGLPTIIPALHRRAIMKGDQGTIRAWMTLFGIYRILSFPGVLKLSTITDPASSILGPEEDQVRSFIPVFWLEVFKKCSLDRFKKILYQPIKFFPIPTSGPLTAQMSKKHGLGEEDKSYISSSWSSISASAIALYELWEVRRPMMEYALKMGYTSFWQRLSGLIPYIPKYDYPSKFEVGKLGLKEEPAGKIRVFAMVDPWTQWLLWPLHKAIQYVLRSIPQDGTFDQQAPVARLIKLVDSHKWRVPKFYSLDLSAATDRLPLSLQKFLMSGVMPAAGAWGALLTSRLYHLNAGKYGFNGSVKYAVGQPMGALSSWVSLAITHHFIVQYCYWVVTRREGKTWHWFEYYAILGDDIVIADPKVAREYLRIMALLGVQLGLAKSLLARKSVCEFAKKLWVDGKDCSMVSLRDVVVSKLSTASASEFMLKHKFNLNSYLYMRGIGYRARGSVTGRLWALSKRLRVILVMLTYPGSVLGHSTVTDWWTMDTISSFYNRDHVPWEQICNLLQDTFIKIYVPKLENTEKKIEDAKLAKPILESFDELVLSNEPNVHSTRWPLGHWHPWSWLLKSDPDSGQWRGGFNASISSSRLLRKAYWYEGWGAAKFSVHYSSNFREYRVLDRSGLWLITQTKLEEEEQIAGFRRPILYSLLRDPAFLKQEALGWAADELKRLGMEGDFLHRFSYLRYCYLNGIPLYYILIACWFEQLMRKIDKEAIGPRVTWETQVRTEEKIFSSFLPVYNRWVAIQRLIQKVVRPPKVRTPLSVIIWRRPWEKSRCELYPSMVTKVGSPISFHYHQRLRALKSKWFYIVRRVFLSIVYRIVWALVWFLVPWLWDSIEFLRLFGVEDSIPTVERKNTPWLVIVGILLILGAGIGLVMFGSWDPGSGPSLDTPSVDPAHLPFLLDNSTSDLTVLQSASEMRLSRLSDRINTIPEIGVSPIMGHGYWE